MARITTDEEFTCDWDWFAVDQHGYIGHFTSAGLRALPRSVVDDIDATKCLIEYFECKNSRTGYSIREGARIDSNGWGGGDKARYVRSFVDMSSKGLYSFDTEMKHGPDANYFLVSRPDLPLSVNDIPEAVRGLLMRTRATISLAEAERVSEKETLAW